MKKTHHYLIGLEWNGNKGSGHSEEITLYPQLTVKDVLMIEKTTQLHAKANEFCFVANSVKFPVHRWPTCKAENS